ncbi:hypothetical protein GCM10009122_60290 [Fulvivirga kasyanovii]|uniref:STAS/SEC14 domain-containing protein n=1 Tax=Fulvivirga kasyanovii TaxID=396812 RepID=A0ABW9RN33_9BACT|nr:hypothetical protein [Fulvivirga kasyanovii]MTI25537.1 hypothetical protein [Fulvivirga kasyanovii]
MIRLYATEKVNLDFDPAVPCFIDAKFGFQLTEEFRYCMKYALQLFKEKREEYPSIGWIANLSQVNVLDPEDSKWMISYWNPAALEVGLRCVAFIEPESDFLRGNVERYTQKSEPMGMVINSFCDLEMAKDWLRSQLLVTNTP